MVVEGAGKEERKYGAAIPPPQGSFIADMQTSNIKHQRGKQKK